MPEQLDWEWKLAIERRLATLEADKVNDRLRRVDISAWQLAAFSAGTGLLIFALTWLASVLGWM